MTFGGVAATAAFGIVPAKSTPGLAWGLRTFLTIPVFKSSHIKGEGLFECPHAQAVVDTSRVSRYA